VRGDGGVGNGQQRHEVARGMFGEQLDGVRKELRFREPEHEDYVPRTSAVTPGLQNSMTAAGN
jgi:hypothetical protein